MAGILRREGKVLLACRPEGDSLAGYWEFPGGKVEPGETDAEALIREMEEELGIQVEVLGPAGVSTTQQGGRIIHLKGYFCTLTSGEPHPHFHQNLAWAEPQELKSYSLAPADIPFLSLFDTLGPLDR